MMFPDDALFEYVLIDLGVAVARRPAPPINPLPCDRWVARSCLQKAIRRAEPELAQRALANLFNYDRRSAWRALTIIALEDVGVADIDLLAQTVAAQRDRQWRTCMGGDWPLMAELARQMAESLHCQAACDLLLRATNDPALEIARAAALELPADMLAEQLWDCGADILGRGLAALAMGGGLAEVQQHRDACAVLDILGEAGCSSHVVATCRTAWKITRNPMSMLLPLVWEQWMLTGQGHAVADDVVPPVQMLGGVPGYALDQFTRIGNTISRALLRADGDLGGTLSDAGVPAGQQSRTIGDLLFLTEGGLTKSRAVWVTGDQLRFPQRQLPAVDRLRGHLPAAMTLLASKRRQIEVMRRQYFHPDQP